MKLKDDGVLDKEVDIMICFLVFKEFLKELWSRGRASVS